MLNFHYDVVKIVHVLSVTERTENLMCYPSHYFVAMNKLTKNNKLREKLFMLLHVLLYPDGAGIVEHFSAWLQESMLETVHIPMERGPKYILQSPAHMA